MDTHQKNRRKRKCRWQSSALEGLGEHVGVEAVLEVREVRLAVVLADEAHVANAREPARHARVPLDGLERLPSDLSNHQTFILYIVLYRCFINDLKELIYFVVLNKV